MSYISVLAACAYLCLRVKCTLYTIRESCYRGRQQHHNVYFHSLTS